MKRRTGSHKQVEFSIADFPFHLIKANYLLKIPGVDDLRQNLLALSILGFLIPSIDSKKPMYLSLLHEQTLQIKPIHWAYW